MILTIKNSGSIPVYAEDIKIIPGSKFKFLDLTYPYFSVHCNLGSSQITMNGKRIIIVNYGYINASGKFVSDDPEEEEEYEVVVNEVKFRGE